MHLPEKNFKMIRYGGFYASKCKSRIHAKKFKHKHISKSLSLMDWRNSILKSFGYDPLICAKCGSEMHFAALYFQFKKIPLEKLYRKAITKIRANEDSLATNKTSLYQKMKAHSARYSYQRHTKWIVFSQQQQKTITMIITHANRYSKAPFSKFGLILIRTYVMYY